MSKFIFKSILIILTLLFSCNFEKEDCNTVEIKEITFLGFDKSSFNNLSIHKISKSNDTTKLNGSLKTTSNYLETTFHFDTNENVYSNQSMMILMNDTMKALIHSINIDKVANFTMVNRKYICGIKNYRVNDCLIDKTDYLIVYKSNINANCN